MTTGHVAGPGEDGPEPSKPHSHAHHEQPESGAHRLVFSVILLLLLALGARAFITVKRTRSHHPGDKAVRSTRPAPQSAIRIAAAPRSVVYVVSASSLGKSHVETSAGPERLLSHLR